MSDQSTGQKLSQALMLAQLDEAKTAASDARRDALLAAVGDVCDYCGKRAFPNSAEARELHGPNEANNFTHRHHPHAEMTLCKATSIHHRLRWEASR